MDHHSALIYVAVLMSAADHEMDDSEIEAIGDIVAHWPVFHDFDHNKISGTAAACVKLLAREDGLDVALNQIREGLPEKLNETAYLLACNIAAADGEATQEELRLLEMLGDTLNLGRLERAALERASRARHRTA
jgi:tellurite resistance protein